MKHESKFSSVLRFNRWFYLHHMKVIARILDFLVRIVFYADIPSSVPRPAGVKYCHYGLGIVVHPRAIIGENTKIYQNVTIGCRNGFGPPTVGSNCEIGGPVYLEI